MAASPATHRVVNRWSSRVIPIILAGLIGFVTWVCIVLVAVHYLLHPPQPIAPRHGAAIAIITIYFVLFALFLWSYARLLQALITHSGHVPRPAALDEEKRSYEEKGFLDRPGILEGRVMPPPGLERFYSRQVYECEIDGLPRFCTTCKCWKPDRSHHCGEEDRCIYKMDHYCPWAGGIVCEANFNFFIQWLMYTASVCLLTLIVTAYFSADLHRKNLPANGSWYAAIVIVALFFLFSFGVGINSLRFAFTNSTTVDDLTQRNRVTHLAVLMPSLPSQEDSVTFGTIRYPLGSERQELKLQPGSERVYAILPSLPGKNPYNLGSGFANFKMVMGNHWYEWFLPLSHSPCFKRRIACMSEEAGRPRANLYKLGPLLDEMKKEAGIPTESLHREKSQRRRRRRSSHRREDENLRSNSEKHHRGSNAIHGDDRATGHDESGN